MTDGIFESSDNKDIDYNVSNTDNGKDNNLGLEEDDSDGNKRESPIQFGPKKRASSSKGSGGKGKRKTPWKDNNTGRGVDGFNALMMTIARRKNADLEASSKQNNSSGKKVDNIVHLVES